MIEPRIVTVETGREAAGDLFLERAFSRATGASLVRGNRVGILRDAEENYPAWLGAIHRAEKTIHFESYILRDDNLGSEFAAALAARARAGVKVRLISDWLGGLGKVSRRFRRWLTSAGIEVRSFNPPFFDSPFGWLSRDHRKLLTVDGRVGFVSGLCVGEMWVGDSARGVAPWRDTGIEIEGPAVADLERAFAQTWGMMGSPLSESDLPKREEIQPTGEVALRVIASEPNSVGLYRLDQVIAAGARERLWLTDAYYAGTTPYVQALRAAARDGVDVRLLAPQTTDLPIVRALSHVGYRPLLEAGVRIYEWNGTMLHAKTAVADGRWARVGSSNLNPASWVGNWELDVVVEDERFAREMEEHYLQDLENATEIVLNKRRRVQPAEIDRRARHFRPARLKSGSSGRAAAGALSLGSAVGAAITNRRELGPSDANALASAALVLFVFSLCAIWWPPLISAPAIGALLWLAISLSVRAFRLYRRGKRERAQNEVHSSDASGGAVADSFADTTSSKRAINEERSAAPSRHL
ncbi:MAG: phospholipase D-like domain-containing protein [Blastocatellia bacterium]|nr:phospholipase D-like domain-containing protein [Blastocatellia bacterium]